MVKTSKNSQTRQLMNAKTFVIPTKTAKPSSMELLMGDRVETTNQVIASLSQVLTAQTAMANTGIWTST